MQMSEEGNRQFAEGRGGRAEQVAGWYFRLNGVLSIPGFIVHPDKVQTTPLTEGDLIGVRFPGSEEIIDGRKMEDDRLLTDIGKSSRILFLLVEVTTGLCKINRRWRDRKEEPVQRVIRRLGFARDENQVSEAAMSMYDSFRWTNDGYVLQHVAIGGQENPDWKRKYPEVLQITWTHISEFLFQRFKDFPEKLRSTGRAIHSQWPDFGRYYGERIQEIANLNQSHDLVWQYIAKGCLP